MRTVPTYELPDRGPNPKSKFLAQFIAANPQVRFAARRFLARIGGGRNEWASQPESILPHDGPSIQE